MNPALKTRVAKSAQTSRDIKNIEISFDMAPMEARLESRLPQGHDWQYEPKWDGFRCLAFKRGGTVELRAKSGKSLTRFFPDIIAALADLP